MADDVLLDALDRLRGTGLEFHGFLANHGPMAAEALPRIGGAAAVPRWVDAYRARLGEAPGVVRGIDGDEWREHLGDVRLAGDWTDLLRRESRDRPWPELLARWWERLLPGMAASAVHGMIRTAHAVRSLRAAGDDPDPLLVDELAQGLALWAARYQTVPGAPALAGADGAVAALAALPRLDPDMPSAGPGISGRLAVLDGLAGFPSALDRWGAPDGADAALDDLVGAAGRVLAARDDAPIAFCHAVTGPAAVRLVLPALPEPLHRPSVAVAWQVVGGIVAAFAAPRLPAESTPAMVTTAAGVSAAGVTAAAGVSAAGMPATGMPAAGVAAAGPASEGGASGAGAREAGAREAGAREAGAREAGASGVGAAEPAGAGAIDVDGLLRRLPGQAVEHGDEHVVKLTEAALREHARTGDATLLVAADRFRERLGTP